MSRYSCPQQVSILPGLKLEVISIACGRQHTLSLTNNGVSDQFLILGLTTGSRMVFLNDLHGSIM
jgi:hypothetical protein